MNIMKKKPELLKRTGKSSLTHKNFFNNLKENDLHFENKQITQCVFLGVLRLKPVPSIFTTNVPSVSTTVESNKAKRIKNNNINNELNKNSSTNNLNKVLCGKVTKKNPQKIKAAVKKVPIKKPNIKIKLNPKKKMQNELSKPSTSNNTQDEVSSEISRLTNQDSIVATTTITLNPIMSSTKFNPVQNLFNKLKQRIDESQNQPGPSRITSSNKGKEGLKLAPVKYKVCKINANIQGYNVNSTKKLKKTLLKKPYDRLPLPVVSTSPITISDTESTGKKEKEDVIFLDENNSNNSYSGGMEKFSEDVIVIKDDPRPKSKERTSPRTKPASPSQKIFNQEVVDNDSPIIITDEHKSNETNDITQNEVIASVKLVAPIQNQEVIIIADDSKQTEITEKQQNPNLDVTNKSDVIVIDEVKEVRVSPRLRKLEEKSKEVDVSPKRKKVDEVIVITDDVKIVTNKEVQNCLEKYPADMSDTHNMNFVTENLQNDGTKAETTPSLLKIAGPNEDLSLTIKKELIEAEINTVEKPRRRKNSTMASTLLPPMLLNAPMLLRSELAQKKPNYGSGEKPRIRKARDKKRDTLHCRYVESPADQSKNSKNTSIKLIITNTKNTHFEKEYLRPQVQESLNKSQSSQRVDVQQCDNSTDEVICISDSSKNEFQEEKKLSETPHDDKIDLESEGIEIISQATIIQEIPSQESAQKENSNDSLDRVIEKDDIIIINQEEQPKQTFEIEDNPVKMATSSGELKLEAKIETDDDIIIIKEENHPKERVSSRLLRSGLTKQKLQRISNVNDSSKSTEIESVQTPNVTNVNVSLPETNETINLTEEPELNKKVSPRLLRSNVMQQKGDENQEHSVEENIITIKEDEDAVTQEKLSSQLPQPQKTKPKSAQKSNQPDLDEIVVVSQRRERRSKERASDRLLRSELRARERLSRSVKTELEEIVVLIHDEPKQTLKSPIPSITVEALNETNTEDVYVVEPSKNSEEFVKSSRCLRSATVRKLSPSQPVSTRIKLNRTVKKEVLPVEEDFEQNDIQIIPENNSEHVLEPVKKIETDNSSHRVLRSDMIKKECLENFDIATNADTNFSPRLLRSNMSTPKYLQVENKQHSPRTPERSSPRFSEKRNTPQKSPPLNPEANIEMLLNVKKEIIEEANENSLPCQSIVKEATKKISSSLRKNSKNVLNKQLQVLTTSKKMVESKKKERRLNRKTKSLLLRSKKTSKTPMLLRSELAQLKNVTTDITRHEKMILKRKKKSRAKNNAATKEQLCQKSSPSLEVIIIDQPNESATSNLDAKSRQKNKKSPKTKTVLTKSVNEDSGKMEENTLKISDSPKDVTSNQPTENTISNLDTRNPQKNRKSPRTMTTQTVDDNSGNTSKVSESLSDNVTNDRLSESTTINSNIKSPQKNKRSPKTKPIITEIIDVDADNTSKVLENTLVVDTTDKSKRKNKKSPKTKGIVTQIVDSDNTLNVPENQLDVIFNDQPCENTTSKVELKSRQNNRKSPKVNPAVNQTVDTDILKVPGNPLDTVITSDLEERSSQKNKKSPKSQTIVSETVDVDSDNTLNNLENTSNVVTDDKSKQKSRKSPKTKTNIQSVNKSSNTMKIQENPLDEIPNDHLGETTISNLDMKNRQTTRKSPKTNTIIVPHAVDVEIISKVPENSLDIVPNTNENTICNLDTRSRQKMKRPPKTNKPDVTQVDNSKNSLKVTENSLNSETSMPVANKNNNTEDNLFKIEKSSDISKIQSDQYKNGQGSDEALTDKSEKKTEVAVIEPVTLPENKMSRTKSLKRKNSKKGKTGNVDSPKEDTVIVKKSPAKRNSSQTRKTLNNRRQKAGPIELHKTPEVSPMHPTQIDLTQQTEHCNVNVTPKKVDITIFDFDESEEEPEVVPLRLSGTPKKNKSAGPICAESTPLTPSRETVIPKSKKEKTTKAQAKANLLNMFVEKPVPKVDPLGQNTNSETILKNATENKKTKPTNKKKTDNEEAEQNKTKGARKKRSPNKSTSNNQITSKDSLNTSTSPLKQTTITDMFSRVLPKKEKPPTNSIFDPPSMEQPEPQKENLNEKDKMDMPPPKPDAKPLHEDSDGYEEDEDDDSDCESRREWIPEEYAEYKFKYSAKKMMTYKPIHKCKICLLILPTYYRLSKHKEEHSKREKPYNCKHCDDAFSNIDDLTAHLRVHKGKHPYTCKKCDIGFWSKKSLDAHIPIHVLRKAKQPNKRFRCDVCAKEFGKLCDMERHTRVHTGEKPCVCNICNKRFQQSHNLSKHLLTHLHVKPYHCEICNKQFGRNDVLNRHLLTHSVEKPIKCPLCMKGFIRQSQLNNHMKKNHPDSGQIEMTEEVVEAE